GGIVAVPGSKGVFPLLTVAENLRVAAWMYRDDEEHVRRATEQVFGYFPILRQRSGEAAGNLSGGEQQMLTLAQAFLSRPRLLMIDELSLGLAPSVVEQLLGIVRSIHDQGTTVVLVEQSVNVALGLAQRAVFMEKGEIKFSGPTEELMRRPDILRSVYLQGTAGAGGRLAVRAPEWTDPGVAAELALDVRHVTVSFGGIRAVDDVSFTLEEGRALGFIGPNGRARPPSSTPSPDSCAPAGAPRCCSARTSPTWARTAASAPASCAPSRTPASSPTSRCGRTCSSPSSATWTTAARWPRRSTSPTSAARRPRPTGGSSAWSSSSPWAPRATSSCGS